jgi:hypothetical protein
MRISHPIWLLLGVLLAGCSPSSGEPGITKQEMEVVTALVTNQTTNGVVGMERAMNGDVTVWTAPAGEGRNPPVTTFTLRKEPTGWVIVKQKLERSP